MRGGVFWGYFVISLVALGVDVGLLFVLLGVFNYAAVAGALSYLVGNFVQYVLSVRYVFGHRRGKLQNKPLAEYGAWLATTAAALAITALILHIGADRMSLPILPVKAVAVAVSFFAAYFLRAKLLFPQRQQ